MTDSLAPATVAVAAGRPSPRPDAPLNEPLVAASTYRAGGPVGYGRYGNPTWEAFETVLGALEGGVATAFASGMAAVSAVLSLVVPGGTVVAPTTAYSGTLALARQLADRGLLHLRQVDVTETSAVAAACVDADLLWLESPTNPLLEVADLGGCASAARRAGTLAVVDNTFATPLVQQPLSTGADIVVHSASKYLSGHSDVLLGATVAADPDVAARLARQRSMTGSVPGPAEAWLALRGMRTLHLRMERAQHNASVLAERLARHPGVTAVRYPGLPGDPAHRRASAQMRGYGAVVSITVGDDDGQAADAVVDAVRLWVPATSLGGVESMLERRRRWPAESHQVPPTLLRLSVGVEDVEDLWADLDQALRHGR